MQNLGKIAASIGIAQLAGMPGAILSRPGQNSWYRRLEKPPFNPPNWVFPVVWPILYTLMGVALFLVWDKGTAKKEVKQALVPFSVQWLLNSVWTPVFFNFKAPLYALGNIVLLWGSIVATIMRFYRISRPAAWLLVPYLLWTSFAAVLNFEIWRRNSKQD